MVAIMLKSVLFALVPLWAVEPGTRPSQSVAAFGVTDRPRLDWPLREGYRRIYPDKVVVLSPRYAPGGCRSDGPVLTYAGGRVEAIHPFKGQPMWPAAVVVEAEPVLLETDHERCLLASPRRVYSLASADGSVQWSYGDDAPDDPLADPESQPALREMVVAGEVLVVASGSDLIGLDRSDGAVRWRKGLESAPVFVRAADRGDTVLCITRGGRRVRLLTIAANTGRLLAESTWEEADPPAALWPLDGQACAVAFSGAFWLVDRRAERPAIRITAAQSLRTAGLHAAGGGLVVVAGDGSVECFRPGFKEARWTYRIPRSWENTLWSDADDRSVVVAAGRTVVALDALSGRLRWRQRLPELVVDLELTLVADSLLICRRDAELMNGAGARRYRLQRLDLGDGRYAGVVHGGDLLTPPVSSFGGMFVREGALILLDGRTLIGYVQAGNDRPPRSGTD